MFSLRNFREISDTSLSETLGTKLLKIILIPLVRNRSHSYLVRNIWKYSRWTKYNLRNTALGCQFKFFKDCIPQILLGPFFNTMFHFVIVWKLVHVITNYIDIHEFITSMWKQLKKLFVTFFSKLSNQSKPVSLLSDTTLVILTAFIYKSSAHLLTSGTGLNHIERNTSVTSFCKIYILS